MKKRIEKFLILFIMCLVCCAGCGSKGDTKDNDESQNVVANDEKDKGNETNTADWILEVGGKGIELPCTLKELEKVGVYITNEAKREELLNTPNTRVIEISAKYGDEKGLLHISAMTGEHTDRAEENVEIVNINTSVLSKEFFCLNKVGIGSSVDDVIEALGEGYEITASLEEDIRNGLSIIRYQDEIYRIIIHFQDNNVKYFEIEERDEG